MSTESQYKLSHRIAKFIVFAIVCGLIILDANLTDLNAQIAARFGMVIIWFWGINFIAHLVEVVCKFNSKHDWL